MASRSRRHAKPPSRLLREVVAWGLVAVAATVGLLVWLGVPWQQVALGCGGLLVVLLLAYLLHRSGLMRLPQLDSPPPSEGGDAADSRPSPEQ